MKTAISLCMFVASAACLTAPAAATDFTLDVPVHVTNMPRLTTGYVTCLVSAVRAGTLGSAANENLIGRNEVHFAFTNGGYDGTITVPIDNTSSHPSTDARSYLCQLFGNVLNDSGHEIAIPARVWRFNYTDVTHIPVDSETTYIEANLP